MPASNIIWRIDDRLIHGQIIIGWCGQLPVKLLVVCDDEIAGTEWKKNLLLMAVPPDLPAQVLSVNETAQNAQKWTEQKKLVVVLLKSPFVLKNLIESRVPITKVNVGGIHYRENRKEYLSYLFLSDEEVEIFMELIKNGIQFECQDLPSSNSYNLQKLLEKK